MIYKEAGFRMQTVKERFLRYVALDTGSDENSGLHPSTDKQWALAKLLRDELEAMGVADARLSDKCYVYGSIPANANGQPAIGLIAHMDTASGTPTGPVRASAIQYNGGDITLAGGAVIRESEFESLQKHIGHELIVTDGTTLLGADDKAGVAEIMAASERLIADPSYTHGKACVAFTPVEEIGEGPDFFDIPGFGAEFAYTLDGGGVGELEIETFNAAGARVHVKGFNIHPGSAKNKMKNAARLAMEFAGMLPAHEVPEHTEGHEGFYHLTDLKGDEENAELRYIVRDHDSVKFEARKARLQKITDYLNDKYGAGTFTLTLKDGYRNMKEKLDEKPEAVQRAVAAMEKMGDTPVLIPIRGGTDGARLSYEGLPCPNLPTGGYNIHGPLEYASVQEMERITDMLLVLLEAR